MDELELAIGGGDMEFTGGVPGPGNRLHLGELPHFMACTETAKQVVDANGRTRVASNSFPSGSTSTVIFRQIVVGHDKAAGCGVSQDNGLKKDRGAYRACKRCIVVNNIRVSS